MREMDRRSRPLMAGPCGKGSYPEPGTAFIISEPGLFAQLFSGLSGEFFLISLFPAVRYDKEKKLMKEAQSWKFKK